MLATLSARVPPEFDSDSRDKVRNPRSAALPTLTVDPDLSLLAV